MLQPNEHARSYALMEVQTFLREMSRRELHEFNLPEPMDGLPPLPARGQEESVSAAIQRRRTMVIDAIPKLNDGQRGVFNAVVGALIPGTSVESIVENNEMERLGTERAQEEQPAAGNGQSGTRQDAEVADQEEGGGAAAADVEMEEAADRIQPAETAVQQRAERTGRDAGRGGLSAEHQNQLDEWNRIHGDQDEIMPDMRYFPPAAPEPAAPEPAAPAETPARAQEGTRTAQQRRENQRRALPELSIPSLDDPPRLFFVDAPGGTGKTFVINVVMAYLQLKGMEVLPVATSGVAAQLLDGGRTAHSALRIPTKGLDESSACPIEVNSELATELRGVDCIVWDEAVMCHRYAIEAVERTLRDLMNNSLPFGGKVVVFCGDFRQILPIVKRTSSIGQILDATLKRSVLYRLLNTLTLTENMRLSALREDPNAAQVVLDYPDYLLRVGEGREGELQCRFESSYQVTLSTAIETTQVVLETIRKVYPNIRENYKDGEWLTSRGILTIKNRFLQTLNELVGRNIPGQYKVYKSADTVENEEVNLLRFPVDCLN